MAVTKLRADAPPFRLSPSCHLQFPTPPPPHLMAVSRYHPVPCSPSFPVVPTNPLPPFPVVPAYPLPPFPGPAAPPIYGIPWPPHPPAPVSFPGKVVPPPPRRKARVAFLRPRKGVYSPRPRLPAGTEAFLVKANPLPPPAPLSSKDVPSPPPTPKKIALLSREALPHGTPPHKLMLLLGGGAVADKLRAKAAAATMACAAESVMPGRQDLAPAPAAGPRHGRLVAPPGSLLGQPPQAAWSGGSKVKGVGRRQAKTLSGSPSPAFTTRPPYPIPAPEWRKEPVTTVMIRNIPNKLKPCEMVQLLDEHCARANGRKKKKAAAVVASYDFVYLPMDFSKSSSNMGYAFVNLTTAEAARGLHYALHGARWKVHGTKKVIHICAARIQGKEALVSHFSGSTFPCHTDEYLPAAFSPPRDGASASTSAAVTPPPTATHVGTRVHRPAPPAPRQPLPVPPPPQQLEWRRVERVIVHEAA